MSTVKIRPQGGTSIITIPKKLAIKYGWATGTEIEIDQQPDGITLRATKRQARGSLTVAELLGQIDVEEIAALNEGSKGFAEAKPVGREVW